MFDKCFLSTAYFGNIQYFSKFFIFKNIIIELFENYPKQSYRNRCIILGANGPLTLSIPVVHNHGEKTLISDLKIDYSCNWQKIHFKSIESAYKNSPFFDYYIDLFLPFFSSKEVFLIDLNNKITKQVLSVLQITDKYSFTDKYDNDIIGFDYRNAIHPKPSKIIKDDTFSPQKYYQVFSGKFEFIGNLSILDLIFNIGPDSAEILKNSVNVNFNE